MPYDPDVPHRRSIRLRGYDYSRNGAYFVTLCTQHRTCLFGDIVKGEMILSEIGQIVVEEYIRSFVIREEMETDEWIIMPNHVHCVVIIEDRENLVDHRRGERPLAPTSTTQSSRPSGYAPRSLASFVTGFKTGVTKRVHELPDHRQTTVWQRNYYERIVRDENALQHIRAYIAGNPQVWEQDDYYVAS